MKHILLAINGDIPTTSVFQYSVGLCKRIHAELDILQFIKERKLPQCISSTKKQVMRMGRFLENSFAGVAFAEQGSIGLANEFLPDVSRPLMEMIRVNKIDMPFQVGLSKGNPKIEILNYIENHQKVVLTIFDPSKDSSNNPQQFFEMIEQIKKRLSIPLVLVK